MDKSEKNEYFEILKKIIEKKQPVTRNIGIVGEYGAGKTTHINKAKNVIEEEYKEKIVNINFSYNIIKSEAPSSDNRLYTKILNDLFRVLLVNFDPEDTLKFRSISINTENYKKWSERKLIISIIVCTLCFAVIKNSFFNINIIYFKLIILSMFVFSIPLFIINLYQVISLKKISITKIKNIELVKKQDEDLIQKYLDKIIYLIENNEKKFEVLNIIIEDIDRLDDIEILDELKRLNKLMNECLPEKIVIFTYALRRNVFNKTSEKGIETRTLSKMSKYFDEIVWIKPHIKKKSIFTQIKEIFSKNLYELILDYEEEESIRKITEKYSNQNTELFDDYRTLKDFVNTIIQYKKNGGNISPEVYMALFLKYNVEYIIDFSKYYEKIINGKDYYKNKGNIDDLDSDILDIIIIVNEEIKKKYSKKELVFNSREIDLLISFIKDDINCKYSLSLDFNEIIGYDIIKEYFEANRNIMTLRFANQKIEFKDILTEQEIEKESYNDFLPNKSLIEFLNLYYNDENVDEPNYNSNTVDKLIEMWISKIAEEDELMLRVFFREFEEYIKKMKSRKKELLTILLESNTLIQINKTQQYFYNVFKEEIVKYDITEKNIVNYLFIKDLKSVKGEKNRLIYSNMKYIYNKSNRIYIYNSYTVSDWDYLFEYIYIKFDHFEKTKIYTNFRLDEKILLYEFIERKNKEEKNVKSKLKEEFEKYGKEIRVLVNTKNKEELISNNNKKYETFVLSELNEFNEMKKEDYIKKLKNGLKNIEIKSQD